MPSSRIKVHLAFDLEIKVPESMLLRSSVKFERCHGVGPLGFCQVQILRLPLFSVDKLNGMMISFSHWTWYRPTMPKVPIPALITMVTLPNWPDLNPTESLWRIAKRKIRATRTNNANELKASSKANWAS
ncbi:hypothetical protein CHARACLAT_025456 [Characodon lateralis]|uniref:Tc1-like transposase DDE domain-containing protein n=1 Tax=Characodon lateralis TaxID=208331 RepID=A0ABU7DCN6_9TELE|nr:hypothetical protein [Characodon lateralis]